MFKQEKTETQKASSAAVVSHHLEQIVKEMERARKLHPTWPDDPVHEVSIVAEEMGEAIRAANQCLWDGLGEGEYEKELIETAAMCLRALCGG